MRSFSTQATAPLRAILDQNRALIVPALVATAYGLCAPPAATWGSEAIEHGKDALAVLLVLCGFAMRLHSLLAGGGARRAGRPSIVADMAVLGGIFLMHGHEYALAIGAAAIFLLVVATRDIPLESGGQAGPQRGGRHAGPQRSVPAGAIVREALAAAVVLGILALTEAYEYASPAAAGEVQWILLALAGGLAVLLAPAIWREVAANAADHGPTPGAVTRTRGILVTGRARSVDVLENLISFGSLKPILTATLSAAELKAGDRLIDVGCGSGKLAIAASRLAPGAEVLGVDATPAMIELARAQAAEAGSPARFRVAIAEALPLPAEWADAVTSSYFFHHLPSGAKKQAIEEMWRVLAPGGRLVVTDYARPRTLLGWLASWPLRFNTYEHVQGQLAGELEGLIAGVGELEVCHAFLGYITVFRVRKAAHAEAISRSPRALRSG